MDLDNTHGIEYLYLTCQCGNVEHSILFTYDSDKQYTDDDAKRFPEMSVNVQLSPYLGFWGRLKAATRYLFGRKWRKLHWAEAWVRPSDLDKIESMIRRYRADIVKVEAARAAKRKK